MQNNDNITENPNAKEPSEEIKSFISQSLDLITWLKHNPVGYKNSLIPVIHEGEQCFIIITLNDKDLMEGEDNYPYHTVHLQTEVSFNDTSETPAIGRLHYNTETFEADARLKDEHAYLIAIEKGSVGDDVLDLVEKLKSIID